MTYKIKKEKSDYIFYKEIPDGKNIIINLNINFRNKQISIKPPTDNSFFFMDVDLGKMNYWKDILQLILYAINYAENVIINDEENKCNNA